MKRLFLLLTLVPALAFGGSYYTQRLGNFDYTYGDNGYSGTGQQLGQFYYYNDNYGSGVGQRLGNFYYYNYTPNGYGY